jgi:hypothetical protein
VIERIWEQESGFQPDCFGVFQQQQRGTNEAQGFNKEKLDINGSRMIKNSDPASSVPLISKMFAG